jgi:hypothetical protein
MDCQHVQHLLPFVERKCEELDAVERDAVQQHLAKCPACAALAQAERRLDEALGPVLRDVSVPADLQQKVMKRLAAERSVVPWKRGAAVLAASLLIALGAVWFLRAKPTVTEDDVIAINHRGAGWDEAKVEKYFADRGLRVVLPSDLDYEFLRKIEIVEEFNQRVAKLSFRAQRENDRSCQADVLILPHGQFRVDQLPEGTFTNLQVVHKEDFTYLIFFTGSLEALRRDLR